MKKALSLLLAAATTLTVLSGCSGSSDTASAPGNGAATASGSAATEEKATIKFWDGNWDEKVFGKVQELWEKEHPNIKIEPEFLVDKGQSDKYTLALQNGTAPDVLACALDWTTTYGAAGFLEPLNDYVKKDNVDTTQFIKGAINASTVNGKLYALPFRSETYTLFYNKDILSAAGFDKAPETWDQVKEIAKATTKGDVAGYGVCGTNYGNYSFQYITMLNSSGGSILSSDNTKSTLNSDVALQTAQLYKDLSAYAPSSKMENDNVANRTLFASGKLAMYMSGVYDVPEIIKANPKLNFACAMVPTQNGADRSSILGGWSVAVAKNSKNKEAAWKFVQFLTRPDVAAIYTNTFTGTGVRAQAFDQIPEEIIKPNAEALAFAKTLPSVPKIVGIRQAIFNDLSPTLTDSVTVQDAIKKLDADVNDQLK